MANVIADFLIERVQANGWISVGNIMFEDAVPVINPITSCGNVCLSPGRQLIFSAVRFDTHVSYCVEEGYLAQDYRNHGVQQTIICNPFDRLRQFDMLMFSNWLRTDEAGENYLAPTIPKVSMVEKITLDPETGLADPSLGDIVTSIDGKECSAINLYPDDPNATTITKYTGMRIKEYQEFIKTQKMFCKLVQKMTGIGDLI